MTAASANPPKRFRYNATLAIVIAMIAGVVAGLIGGPAMAEIKFLGDIFFRLIQMGIVPFVMCQIIEAVGSLTGKQLGSIGIKAVVAFLVSSLLASAFGLFSTWVFQPGAGLSETELVQTATTDLTATTTTIQDTLTGFFSSNIVRSMGSGGHGPLHRVRHLLWHRHQRVPHEHQ